MNKTNCEIFIKNIGTDMPNSDLIMKCYEEFGYKYITLFFIDGKKIYVDKEHSSITDFIEDLYGDVNKSDGFVLVFHNENQLNFIDQNKDNSFYKTNKTINVSKNDCDCLDDVISLDKEKYKAFFQMFLHDNFYVEINVNSIDVYGDYQEKNGYIFSKLIEEPQNNITTALVLKNNCNSHKCYICEKENNIFENTRVVNKVMNLCNHCFNQLNCRKCNVCHNYFSPRYMMSYNTCVACAMKTNYKDSDMLFDNSIGVKYLELVTNPYSNIDFYNVKLSETNVKKMLDNKTLDSLLDLKNKADDFVKKIDENFYSAEKIRLVMKLQRQIVSV